MEHLRKQLNKSTIDKENVRTLLKVLQANPLLRIKNPFKKNKVKSSNNKSGGAHRNSTSSPVRQLPEDSRPETGNRPRRYYNV